MSTLHGPSPIQSPPLRYSQLCRIAILELNRVSKLDKKARFLEIGSWTGASSALLSFVGNRFLDLKLLENFELVCVDPLIPYLNSKKNHYEEMTSALLDNGVKEYFLRNLAQFANINLVKFKQMKSKEFYEINRDFFNLIYIDGAHDYASVLDDLTYSKVLVVENGILCGDDLELLAPPSRILHWIALAKKSDFIFGYHPGVTQAFRKVFPDIEQVNQSGLFSLVRKQNEFQSLMVQEDVGLIPHWLPLKNSIYLLKSIPEYSFNLILHERGIFKVPFELGEVAYKDFLFDSSKVAGSIEYYCDREEYFKTQIDRLIDFEL